MNKISWPAVRLTGLIGTLAFLPVIFHLYDAHWFLVVLLVVILAVLAVFVVIDIIDEHKKSKRLAALEAAAPKLCQEYCEMLINGATDNQLELFLAKHDNNKLLRRMAISARMFHEILKIQLPEQKSERN